MNTTQTYDSVVRARIDTNIKERVAAALADMGLSVSDAIWLPQGRLSQNDGYK